MRETMMKKIMKMKKFRLKPTTVRKMLKIPFMFYPLEAFFIKRGYIKTKHLLLGMHLYPTNRVKDLEDYIVLPRSTWWVEVVAGRKVRQYEMCQVFEDLVKHGSYVFETYTEESLDEEVLAKAQLVEFKVLLPREYPHERAEVLDVYRPSSYPIFEAFVPVRPSASINDFNGKALSPVEMRANRVLFDFGRVDELRHNFKFTDADFRSAKYRHEKVRDYMYDAIKSTLSDLNHDDIQKRAFISYK